jgi:hypothetical protein
LNITKTTEHNINFNFFVEVRAMQHHELLELCCYLATGDVTYLASAPPAVQELACSFRSLERHEVTPMDAHPNDALMLEISRIGSPQRLAGGVGLETPFVPTVQEGTELYVALLKTSWTSNVPTPVSVRAAYSGQLLFSKYLTASITASADGAASVLHRLQQSTNFSLPFVLDQCMFIATSFLKGVTSSPTNQRTALADDLPRPHFDGGAVRMWPRCRRWSLPVSPSCYDLS